MRNPKTLVVLYCSLLMMFTSVTTQATTKNDFAYGYSLEVDGDGAIYSLYLNEHVYRGLTREDRGDLRIFNGHGQVVPHAIRRIEKKTKQALTAIELPIFPLYKNTLAESIASAGHNVHITTNEQGTIIDLNYGKVAPAEKMLAAYIIDASSLDNKPEFMTINWNEVHQNFVMTVRVEGSNDLTHWHNLVAQATLSRLQHGKHTLLQKTIDLPRSVPKYLRLSWVSHEPLMIDSIRFDFPETYQAQERQWSGFTPVKVDSKHQAYYFNTKTVLPVDRINFQLPERNTLVKVLLESSSSEQGPWFSRYHGLVYDLQYGDSTLKNPNIHQSVFSHRYWRVTILNGEGKFVGEPVLRLGWIPEELLFVASGESPFTLAYGSARVSPVVAPLTQLLSESSIKQQGYMVKPARLGAAIDLGDDSRLQPEKPPVDWKRYLLWAVLVAGVMALALMALRLYKQMEEQAPEE